MDDNNFNRNINKFGNEVGKEENLPVETSQKYNSEQQELQKVETLKMQLDALERKYNMEKILLDERTRIKQEEINTLKAHISEQRTDFKIELKKREDEISSLKQKIFELENKYSIEISTLKEKIKNKEEEIKDLNTKYEQDKNKLFQEIEFLKLQIKTKEEQTSQLENVLKKRETELLAQIEWKQQELLMLKSRFEEEITKLQSQINIQKNDYEKILYEKKCELEDVKSSLLKEINELEVKYAQKQAKVENLFNQISELQKEYYDKKNLSDILSNQIFELKSENRILKETIYSPDNIAKSKIIELLDKNFELEKNVVKLQQDIAKEKKEKEDLLFEKNEEIKNLKLDLEKYNQQLSEQSNKFKEEIEKDYQKKILKLEEEKSVLLSEIEVLNSEVENKVLRAQIKVKEKDDIYENFIENLFFGLVNKIKDIITISNKVIESSENLIKEIIKKISVTKKTVFDKLFAKIRLYNDMSEVLEKFKNNFFILAENFKKILFFLDEFGNLTKPIVLNKQKVKMDVLLNKVFDSYKELLYNKKVQITTEFEKVPQTNVDEQKIEFVFKSIIDNALESLSKDGNIKVQLFFEKETNMIGIRFIDNGEGISKQDIEKIFQPFFTTKNNHNGLSLSLVQKILIVHSGKIIINSEKNKGTTVTVRIPVLS